MLDVEGGIMGERDGTNFFLCEKEIVGGFGRSKNGHQIAPNRKASHHRWAT